MMHLLSLRYAISLSLVLLATTVLPVGGAANPSAMARREFAGFRVLPDEMAPDYRKRQVSTPSAPTPPAPSPPAPSPPAPSPIPLPSPAPSPPPASSSQVVETPLPLPPVPPSPVASPSEPSSVSPPSSVEAPIPSEPSSAPSSSNQGSSSVADPPSSSSSSSSSSSNAIAPPSPITPGTTSQSLSDSASSTLTEAILPGSTTTASAAAGSSPAPPGSESLTNAVPSTILSPDTSTSIGDSGSTSTTGSAATITFGTPLPSGSDPVSQSESTSSSVSYSLSYEYATVTAGGSESISIGTVSVSAGYVPVAGPAPVAAPLVVQEVLPNVPNPACTMDYLPADVWATSGTSTPPPSVSGNNTQTTRPPVISQCNNGTKVSNRIGSQIHLKFTGTEVSLLMVPGLMGGDYDIKLDNGPAETLSNYNPDVTDCQVTTSWSRTDLPNKPHDITVIVKGSNAASAGGSQIEFNGLVFTGPKTEEPSKPNLGLIIGATVGGVVVIAALVAIAVFCIRRRRARQVTPDHGPATLASPSFRPQTVMSGHSGHTRADSAFSGAGSTYNPAYPNAAGAGAYGGVMGHTRMPSDAPLMGMVQGQQSPPWQPGSPVMYNSNMPPPGAAQPVIGSPHSRTMSYAGQERQSYAASHNRETSYGSDGRNPFE